MDPSPTPVRSSSSATASASAATPTTPAPEAEDTPVDVRKVLAAIPEDPAPPNIIKETHYFVSNEKSPEKFRRHAEGRGGIYLGVGAEQNYLFAGWARPDVLIVADFDQWVVDVHFMHGVLMVNAADPEAFVDLWSRAKRGDATRLLTAASTDTQQRERILERFAVMRPGVFSKLLNQRVAFRGRDIPTWLTDIAQYEHLTKLYRTGRVRCLRGDFTGRLALAGVARAARELELPVRTVYLSNVEDYFYYSGGLGPNLAAQPVDDKSVLLRTVAVDGTEYRYIAQQMQDFQAWLAEPGINHRLDIFTRASVRHGPRGLFIGGPPGDR